MTDEEIIETVKMIEDVIPKKHMYDKPIWQGVLDLIKLSNYGKKDASVETVTPLPPGTNKTGERVEGGDFDGVQMHMLGIYKSIFSSHGSIEMIPYTKGIDTRSMTFKFKANKSKITTP